MGDDDVAGRGRRGRRTASERGAAPARSGSTPLHLRSPKGRLGRASRSEVPAIGERAPSSDVVLVVAVARRDGAALAELYRRHSGALFCVALRVLSDRQLALDVVQDAFLRLWRSSEGFDPERGSLRAFLLAQAHRSAVEIVRSETARRRRGSGEANQLETTPVDGDDVLDFVVGQEIRDALATLRRTEREVINVTYFGGHSYVGGASLLGISEETAKTSIRSGLVGLRTALTERGVDPSLTNRALS